MFRILSAALEEQPGSNRHGGCVKISRATMSLSEQLIRKQKYENEKSICLIKPKKYIFPVNIYSVSNPESSETCKQMIVFRLFSTSLEFWFILKQALFYQVNLDCKVRMDFFDFSIFFRPNVHRGTKISRHLNMKITEAL